MFHKQILYHLLFRMAVRLRANDYRDLSLMTHLCGNLDPNVTLTSQTPYVVPWRSIAIHVCNMSLPWEQIMYSINAKLVALCHTDLQQVILSSRRDSPFNPCFADNVYVLLTVKPS